MAQLKLMKKEWFNWFDKTFLDNITAWTEYYYINPDSQYWISDNQIIVDDVPEYTLNGVTIKFKDNTCYLNGTATSTFNIGAKIKDLDPATYSSKIFISGTTDSSNVWVISNISIETGYNFILGGENGATNTATTTSIGKYIRFLINNGTTYNNYQIRFAMNKGETIPSVFNPHLIKIEDILEVLDLGSVDWSTPSANGWCQTSNRVSARPITSLSAMPYLFCAKYKVGSANFVFTNNETIGLDNSPKIVIRSTEFIGKTGIQVKQMLSGVYVIFLKNDAPY